MNNLEKAKNKAQYRANKESIPYCVINLNAFSPLYVVRELVEGMNEKGIVSKHYPQNT